MLICFLSVWSCGEEEEEEEEIRAQKTSLLLPQVIKHRSCPPPKRSRLRKNQDVQEASGRLPERSPASQGRRGKPPRTEDLSQHRVQISDAGTRSAPLLSGDLSLINCSRSFRSAGTTGKLGTHIWDSVSWANSFYYISTCKADSRITFELVKLMALFTFGINMWSG